MMKSSNLSDSTRWWSFLRIGFSGTSILRMGLHESAICCVSTHCFCVSVMTEWPSFFILSKLSTTTPTKRLSSKKAHDGHEAKETAMNEAQQLSNENADLHKSR